MKIQDISLNTNMEKILDKLIQELKRNHSNYFSEGYKRMPDYLMVQCPYHKMGMERKPSAQFRKEDGLFWCFTCHKSAQLTVVITDVLKTDGRAWLLDNFEGVTFDTVDIDLKFNENKEEPKYFSDKVLERYNKKHPYMYQRMLNDEIIEKFQIGYDEENDCLVFPIRDKDGHLLYAATRKINSKFFNFPSGVDKPLYGLYEIYQAIANGEKVEEVYVCESVLDALVIWKHGKYAVAMHGTGTKLQYQQLQELPVPYLILATDNDDAGKEARAKIKKNVTNKFIKELDYNTYFDCNDINEMETKEEGLFLKANVLFSLLNF